MTLPMLFHTRRARALARLVLYGGALLVALPVALSQMMLGTVRQPSHPVAPPFEESWVRSEGLRLRAWTVRGRPERAAVVVAHGLGDTLESFTGVAESNLYVGAAMTAVLVLGLGWVSLWMFKVGYKIKT